MCDANGSCSLSRDCKARIRGAGATTCFFSPPHFFCNSGRFFLLEGSEGTSGQHWTEETRQAMGKLVRDNLAAHFARQPLLTPVI